MGALLEPEELRLATLRRLLAASPLARGGGALEISECCQELAAGEVTGAARKRKSLGGGAGHLKAGRQGLSGGPKTPKRRKGGESVRLF